MAAKRQKTRQEFISEEMADPSAKVPGTAEMRDVRLRRAIAFLNFRQHERWRDGYLAAARECDEAAAAIRAALDGDDGALRARMAAVAEQIETSAKLGRGDAAGADRYVNAALRILRGVEDKAAALGLPGLRELAEYGEPLIGSADFDSELPSWYGPGESENAA